LDVRVEFSDSLAEEFDLRLRDSTSRPSLTDDVSEGFSLSFFQLFSDSQE